MPALCLCKGSKYNAKKSNLFLLHMVIRLPVYIFRCYILLVIGHCAGVVPGPPTPVPILPRDRTGLDRVTKLTNVIYLEGMNTCLIQVFHVFPWHISYFCMQYSASHNESIALHNCIIYLGYGFCLG